MPASRPAGSTPPGRPRSFLNWPVSAIEHLSDLPIILLPNRPCGRYSRNSRQWHRQNQPRCRRRAEGPSRIRCRAFRSLMPDRPRRISAVLALEVSPLSTSNSGSAFERHDLRARRRRRNGRPHYDAGHQTRLAANQHTMTQDLVERYADRKRPVLELPVATARKARPDAGLEEQGEPDDHHGRR